MDFTAIYSNRKTVALLIKEGRLIVRAPKNTPASQLLALIKKKAAWINKHLQSAPAAALRRKTFTEGESFKYLGQELPLSLTADYFSRVQLSDGRFLLSKLRVKHGRALFKNWYKERAEKIIKDRLKPYSIQLQAAPKKIKITSAATRWGSCSSSGTVNFSWRLIMAPVFVIDYVIVHELAHLIHHDHSKAFWDKVRQAYPRCEEARAWLKEHGSSLTL